MLPQSMEEVLLESWRLIDSASEDLAQLSLEMQESYLPRLQAQGQEVYARMQELQLTFAFQSTKIQNYQSSFNLD